MHAAIMLSADNYFETNSATTISGPITYISTLNVADCIIANNTCERMATGQGGSSITPNGLRNIVTGNTIRGPDQGQGIAVSQGAGTDYDSSGTVISNNIIDAMNKYCIYVASAQPGRDLVISNNILNGTADTTNAGIRMEGSWQDVVISGNVIRDCAAAGIIVGTGSIGNTKNMKITSNIIRNCGQSLQASNQHRAGIALNASAAGDISYCQVENNRCYDDQTPKTQLYGIYTSNTANCIIRNNDVRLNATAGIISTGDTGLTIGGNLGFLTANPDTSALAVGGVETEVNQLKATLREIGIIG